MLLKPRLVLSTAIVAALSACGGGSGSPTASTTTPPTTPGSTQVYSSDVGTAAQALAAGKTLTADGTTTSKMALMDYSNGTTKLVAPATVSLKTASNGDVILTLNGVSQTFTSAELSSDKYTYTVNNKTAQNFAILSAWDGASGAQDEIAGTNTYTKYAQPWEFWSNQLSGDKSKDNQGFFVVGTETKPADLTGMPAATYSGQAHLYARASSGYTSFNNSTSQIKTSLDMTANFGAGTVNGTLSNIQSAPESTKPLVFTSTPGTISMDTAAISGNGFSGTLTPDSTFKSTAGNPTINNGTYSGTFFGPAADEVGGVLNLEGSDTNGAFNSNGFFVGKKN